MGEGLEVLSTSKEYFPRLSVDFGSVVDTLTPSRVTRWATAFGPPALAGVLSSSETAMPVRGSIPRLTLPVIEPWRAILKLTPDPSMTGIAATRLPGLDGSERNMRVRSRGRAPEYATCQRPLLHS